MFGIGCKIFTIAGPVILYGIFASWALGLVYWMGEALGLLPLCPGTEAGKRILQRRLRHCFYSILFVFVKNVKKYRFYLIYLLVFAILME